MATVQCPACASNHTCEELHDADREVCFQMINSFRRCADCGLVFANPMPSENDLEKYYRKKLSLDANAGNPFDFEEFSYQLAASRIRLILNHIPLGNNQRCLDIGAGNAFFGKALKALAPHIIYDAVEPSDAWRKTWGQWVTKSYTSLAEADKGAYSLITLNQVLEHIRDPHHFLKEVFEYLQDDGLLFVDVPNRDDLYKQWLGPHLLFWEKRSLVNALKKVGMGPVFCESAGMTRTKAKRSLRKSSWAGKAIDPWRWANMVNRGFRVLGVRKRLNTFKKFQSDTYGGNRQWLRYLGKKIF